MPGPYYSARTLWRGPRGGLIYGWAVRNYNSETWQDGRYLDKSTADRIANELNDDHSRRNA